MLVVIDKSKTAISYDDGSMRVEYQGELVQRVPLNLMEQLVLRGNVNVSSRLLRELAQRNVSTVFESGRGAAQLAWLHGGLSVAAKKRLLQHRLYQIPSHRLAVARYILERKLEMQRAMALSFQWQEALQKLTQYGVGIERATNLDEMMGYEGASSAVMFACYKQQVGPQWGFESRNRRPPQDPLNALFSLSYSMVYSQVLKTTLRQGWDPSVGFVHEVAPGRESLVCDLMEAFRAPVDYLVLSRFINEITPDQFSYSKKEGCRLSKQGRYFYFDLWNEAVESWPAIDEAGRLEKQSNLNAVLRYELARFAHQLNGLGGEG